IDWSSGIPMFDSNSLTSMGSSYYHSDRQCGARSVATPTTGELLFYVGGGISNDQDMQGFYNKIWNRNHVPTLNSDSLLGNTLTNEFQGQCIVPVPGDSSKYYVFSSGPGGVTSQSPYQIYYNIVDMSLDGGLG